ncbi:response regulator transcription factor [Dyadobacter alkalitolerans]|uniref:response regulator transcription factor n=1 Tax=Dyadobacter alkalitolerans TaxID=492736 RepID=UPI0003F826D1|nr:response regulator transcription factor [Dyadobacter alkalitolerans]
MHFLTIDKQPLIGVGLRVLIQQYDADAFVQDAVSLDVAMQLLDRHAFDFIITEIDVGTDINFGLVDMLRQKRPETAVMVYSQLDAETFAVPFMEAGANAFVSKAAMPEEILDAIKTVVQRGRYLSVDHLQSLSPPVPSGLSGKETMVMQLLLLGKTTQQIADTLGVRQNTVSTFKSRVFRKLQVSSPIELYQRFSY